MTTAVGAANRILSIARGEGLPLTKLQLMKLVYISHGFTLARTDDPLFKETVEAWQYGPVVPTVYQATKAFGSEAIGQKKLASWSPLADRQITSAQEQILESVVDKYGHLPGGALSNLTHRSGSPWSQVWNPGEYNIPIPNKIIRRHYKEIEKTGKVTSA